MQTLPGFRDFYPEDCARRNAIAGAWREIARRYGFVEMDGPILEPIELYRKKSGGELVGQLFDFEDKGERHIALRPEMTPTVARMIAAREKHYKKPLKWFSIAPFFRYEKPQEGRLREFIQFNCDIVGDASPQADAELCALVIDLFRVFGLGKEHVILRLSDRSAWEEFLAQAHPDADAAKLTELLAIVDKIEREDPAVTESRLGSLGLTTAQVREFIREGSNKSTRLSELVRELDARGLQGHYEIDLTIVRGLAYYTGLVFEMFDRSRKFRALAGGGRYDHLIKLLSDGGADLPAVGAGIGDVVLGKVIDSVPQAAELLAERQKEAARVDVYVVLADERRRSEMLGIVQRLRDEGFRADYSLSGAKVGKQFQTAEQLGARYAVVVGSEWPTVRIKELATRTERSVGTDEVSAALRTAPDSTVTASLD